MRAIGHFLVFIGFFLVFAVILGVVILSAVALRSCLACVILLPLLPALYLIYAKNYRRRVDSVPSVRCRGRRRPAVAASAS